MEIKAKLKYLKVAPRKTKLVVDLVRGLEVGEAKAVLKFEKKRAAKPILKLIESAIANAKNNFQLSETGLYIKRITVSPGPMLKRWMPRARGRATMIQKKMSHVFIVLDVLKKEKKEKTKEIKPSKEAKKILDKEKEIKKEEKEIKKEEKNIQEESLVAEKTVKIDKKDKSHPKGKSPIAKKMFKRKSI